MSFLDAVATLSGLVAAAAVAAPLLWLLHAARRRHREALAYLRTTGLVLEAVQDVLRRQDGAAPVVRAAREVADAATTVLWQPDGHGDLVVTSATHDGLLGLRVSVHEDGVVPRSYATGAPVWVEHDHDERLNLGLRDRASAGTGLRLRSGVAVPITTQGRCLGVLGVVWPERSRATDRLLPVLELLAAQTALALDHENLILELERRSAVDPLTGVANRRAWDEALRRELPRAGREGLPVSVLMADLDRFKDYNDRHGHQAGDRLLQSVAGTWSPRLRPGDVLCRWGGEEFAVLLLGCTAEGAVTVADDLRRLMPDGATCSVGVAEWDGEQTAQQLLATADERLYLAKAAGRDRVVSSDVTRAGSAAIGR